MKAGPAQLFRQSGDDPRGLVRVDVTTLLNPAFLPVVQFRFVDRRDGVEIHPPGVTEMQKDLGNVSGKPLLQARPEVVRHWIGRASRATADGHPPRGRIPERHGRRPTLLRAEQMPQDVVMSVPSPDAVGDLESARTQRVERPPAHVMMGGILAGRDVEPTDAQAKPTVAQRVKIVEKLLQDGVLVLLKIPRIGLMHIPLAKTEESLIPHRWQDDHARARFPGQRNVTENQREKG